MEFKFSAKSNVIGGGIFSVLNDRKKCKKFFSTKHNRF